MKRTQRSEQKQEQEINLSKAQTPSSAGGRSRKRSSSAVSQRRRSMQGGRRSCSSSSSCLLQGEAVKMTRQQQPLADESFRKKGLQQVRSAHSQRPPPVWDDSQRPPAAGSLYRAVTSVFRSDRRAVHELKRPRISQHSSLFSPLLTASCKNTLVIRMLLLYFAHVCTGTRTRSS